MGAPRQLRKRNDNFSKNVTKRGNVSIGKAAEHEDDGLPASKYLIAFFCFVVIGSSIVQIFSMFQRSPPPLGDD
eukprot:CAMPEP_0197721448 /NCGR_PEP_ID=MMETSP1434-20131217/4490_1 /TAXON_ID=265543 /ORGANISM="Minutocellus polymorphus, Strain CCMP3303" /LENGTH=73 /DNA_ID=CAMNT_0043306455 /DNA_START=30 /DNA_END=251 /DNA_ORIENTATION=-